MISPAWGAAVGSAAADEEVLEELPDGLAAEPDELPEGAAVCSRQYNPTLLLAYSPAWPSWSWRLEARSQRWNHWGPPPLEVLGMSRKGQGQSTRRRFLTLSHWQ